MSSAKPELDSKEEASDLSIKRLAESESPPISKKQKLYDDIKAESTADQSLKTIRIKQRKSAILLGYSGKGYYGMQK